MQRYDIPLSLNFDVNNRMLFYNGIEISEDAILKTLLFNYYVTNYDNDFEFYSKSFDVRIDIPYYYDK